MLVDFSNTKSTSIKSFAVNKRDKMKVTMRFMSGKLLAFAKLSFKSFIYNISKMFCFPTQAFTENYKKYLINKVLVYHILLGTDSAVLQFVFISDPNSDLPEGKFRDIISENIITNKIYMRFDSSHEFWGILGSTKESRKKARLLWDRKYW